ncbi:hypothetical protein BJ165DRAFT_1613317 [Panaeolus papilionaceus]|nr:hypothetical protein BJ165DRAFT_1613317 [Panaeolus papilionaceus]
MITLMYLVPSKTYSYSTAFSISPIINAISPLDQNMPPVPCACSKELKGRFEACHNCAWTLGFLSHLLDCNPGSTSSIALVQDVEAQDRYLHRIISSPTMTFIPKLADLLYQSMDEALYLLRSLDDPTPKNWQKRERCLLVIRSSLDLSILVLDKMLGVIRGPVRVAHAVKARSVITRIFELYSKVVCESDMYLDYPPSYLKYSQPNAHHDHEEVFVTYLTIMERACFYFGHPFILPPSLANGPDELYDLCTRAFDHSLPMVRFLNSNI